MAVLLEMGDTAVKAALDNDYYHRPIDRFPGIDNDEFQRRYKERNKSILKSAITTSVGHMVEEYVRKTHQNTVNSPFHYDPKVIVNVYPYELTESEEVVIVKSIKAMTKGLADVQLVRMSPSQITPSYLKQEVSMVVMYEYDKWLEAQTVLKNFEKHTCPQVTLIAPAISFKTPDKSTKFTTDPFVEMERLVRPFIGLVLMDIELFSLVVKLEKR